MEVKIERPDGTRITVSGTPDECAHAIRALDGSQPSVKFVPYIVPTTTWPHQWDRAVPEPYVIGPQWTIESSSGH